MAIINHLENGRMAIHDRHLEKLLPSYGSTVQSFEMFAKGTVEIPRDLRRECIELISSMGLDNLRVALPVLHSLATKRL
ncbi:MAG: hypothetical protein EOP06_18730 [Proteobacteria bacterium]|nr:MAG: hypothetical protein EOP06_18730 [Pseudomonadota bacterium]